METKNTNTGWQFPIVFLLDDLRSDDARELARLDDNQRASHRQARELLLDYAQRVLDTAEDQGRTAITEVGLTNWEHLRDLMTVLLNNIDGHQR